MTPDDLYRVVLLIMGIAIIMIAYLVISTINEKKYDMRSIKLILKRANEFFKRLFINLNKQRKSDDTSSAGNGVEAGARKTTVDNLEGANDGLSGYAESMAKQQPKDGSEPEGLLESTTQDNSSEIVIKKDTQHTSSESQNNPGVAQLGKKPKTINDLYQNTNKIQPEGNPGDKTNLEISASEIEKIREEAMKAALAQVREEKEKTKSSPEVSANEIKKIKEEAMKAALIQVREESAKELRKEELEKLKKQLEAEVKKDFEKQRLPGIENDIANKKLNQLLEELELPFRKGKINDSRFLKLKRKLDTCNRIREAHTEEELLKEVKDLGVKVSVLTAKKYLRNIWKQGSSHEVRITQLLTGLETEVTRDKNLNIKEPGIVSHFLSLNDKAADQEAVRKLLNVVEGNHTSTQLEHLLKKVRTELKLSSAIDFVKAFNYLNKEEISSLDEKYDLTVQRYIHISEFANEYKKITDFKFAKRLGFVLMSVKLGERILSLSGLDTDRIEADKIKEDYLRIILNAYFYTGLRDEKYLTETFEQSSEGTQKTINTYEELFKQNLSPLIKTKKIQSLIKICSQTFGQLKRLASMETEMGAFDDLLIKEFDSIQNDMNKGREPSAGELAGYYGMIFNVAFHAKDFVRAKYDDPRRTRFYKNAKLLSVGGDLTKVDHKEYVEDDLANSSRPANVVVKAARKLGASNLKIIVDDFYLNDSHLK